MAINSFLNRFLDILDEEDLMNKFGRIFLGSLGILFALSSHAMEKQYYEIIEQKMESIIANNMFYEACLRAGLWFFQQSNINVDINDCEHLNQIVQKGLEILGSSQDCFDQDTFSSIVSIKSDPVALGNLARLNRFKSLTKLKLSNRYPLPKSKILPGTIFNIVSLRELDLSYNEFDRLPANFDNLINLTTLDLSGNVFKKLPENFGNLTNLTKLDLTNNGLKDFPDSFGKLINLITLNLSRDDVEEGNDFTFLPEHFGNLTRLTSLNCYALNKVTTLPESIGKLVNLKKLILSCRISHLPESMKNLTNLRELDLVGNKLSKIPDDFINFVCLKKIYLMGNNDLEKRLKWHKNLMAEKVGRVGLLLAYNKAMNFTENYGRKHIIYKLLLIAYFTESLLPFEQQFPIELCCYIIAITHRLDVDDEMKLALELRKKFKDLMRIDPK